MTAASDEHDELTEAAADAELEAPAPEQATDGADAESDESVEAEAAGAELEESVEDILRAQVAELQERLIRQQADFDNVRKRLRREMEVSGDRAVVRFVRPLLTEMDNFDRAIQAASPDAFQDFATGVSMIKANVDGLLSSQGIEPIPAEGVFDPAVHEVVAEIEVPERQRGEIVEVFRTGYRLGEQVIRAAQVVVAKQPKEADSEAAED